MTGGMLAEVMEQLSGMPDDAKEKLTREVMEATADKIWIPNPGPQTVAYHCEADELFYGGCVSGDTEFLTPDGWKRIDQYEPSDLVGQWDVDGSLTFIKPLGYTDQPCENMWRFQTKRMDMMLSDDHRVIAYDYEGKMVVKTALELAEKPSRHHIPCTFTPDKDGLAFTEDEVRLGVCIHADGSFDGATENYCRITLRKDRKKQRLTAMLSRMGIEWKEYHNPNRPTEVRYTFYSPITTKRYDTWWSASIRQIEIILEEMNHWDGTYSGAIGGDICFNTAIKGDADFMQYCAHSVGKAATIGVREHDNLKWSTMYRVNIRRDKINKGIGLRNREAGKGTQVTRVKVDRMYCFKTETSYWVARRNNNIFCTGNSAGGGKTDLVLGLALNEHKRSLILRRTNKEAEKLPERMEEIVGHSDGLNRSTGTWKIDDKIIDMGGCQLESDKQKRKGIPHSLKAYDEIADFSESQYTFISAWNRSADSTERCRVVCTGNPPTTAEGYWVIKRWAAWLDPTHPNPAKDGELRWYTTIEGKDIEVEGRGPHIINEEEVIARSRTFIRAKLSDNPDLAQTNYDSVLASLPERERLAYRDGRFDASMTDALGQTIPTSWIRAAQERWKQGRPIGVPMCAIGVDMTGGGKDPMILAPRYDGYFDTITEIPAKRFDIEKMGAQAAGEIITIRRDEALVTLDLGGGYGSSTFEHLRDNKIETYGYKGSEAAAMRSKDSGIPFQNKRSAAIWRFREALDPSQPGGSRVALPDDPEMVADLTAPTYVITGNMIRIESKEKVCDRLGRSTDRGDAVVMAWFQGAKEENAALEWIERKERSKKRGQSPKVITGRQIRRR